MGRPLTSLYEKELEDQGDGLNLLFPTRKILLERLIQNPVRDLLVIGSTPAALALAYSATLSGLRVILIESADFQVGESDLSGSLDLYESLYRGYSSTHRRELEALAVRSHGLLSILPIKRRWFWQFNSCPWAESSRLARHYLLALREEGALVLNYMSSHSVDLQGSGSYTVRVKDQFSGQELKFETGLVASDGSTPILNSLGRVIVGVTPLTHTITESICKAETLISSGSIRHRGRQVVLARGDLQLVIDLSDTNSTEEFLSRKQFRVPNPMLLREWHGEGGLFVSPLSGWANAEIMAERLMRKIFKRSEYLVAKTSSRPLPQILPSPELRAKMMERGQAARVDSRHLELACKLLGSRVKWLGEIDDDWLLLEQGVLKGVARIIEATEYPGNQSDLWNRRGLLTLRR